jgi:transposase-like protein
MNCKKCNWSNIIKYWSTSHTQRYLCHDCHSTFSNWWIKKDYSSEFIGKVMDDYCHQHKTAKEVLENYKISSRTLIKWKNKHKEHCDQCN